MTSFAIGVAFAGMNAAEEPGKVQIIKAKGNVSAVRLADKKSAPVKVGDVIQEGSAIQTGKDSSAVLLFSNGSAITVSAESTFAVDSFQQDPFDPASTNYKDLSAEPSKSNTKVTVSNGEIVGNMRKLNKGSSFEFNTPLGVAGIRGTHVYIKVTKDSNGKYTVHVAATEGLVVVTTKSGQTYQVAKGEELTLSFDAANPAEVQASTAKLTPRQEAQIEHAADQSVNVIPGHPFTAATDNPLLDSVATGDQGVGTLGTQIGGSGGGGGSGSSPTPTPSPVTPPPGS